jgi:hypothetical protein
VVTAGVQLARAKAEARIIRNFFIKSSWKKLFPAHRPDRLFSRLLF